MKLYIPIPESIWKDTTTDETKNVKIPAGLYRFTFKIPGSEYIDSIINAVASGRMYNIDNEHFVFIQNVYEKNGQLCIEADIGSPLVPVILVLVELIGLGGIIAVVLSKIERVIDVSTPLILGGGILLLASPKLRKKIL